MECAASAADIACASTTVFDLIDGLEVIFVKGLVVDNASTADDIDWLEVNVDVSIEDEDGGIEVDGITAEEVICVLGGEP